MSDFNTNFSQESDVITKATESSKVKFRLGQLLRRVRFTKDHDVGVMQNNFENIQRRYNRLFSDLILKIEKRNDDESNALRKLRNDQRIMFGLEVPTGDFEGSQEMKDIFVKKLIKEKSIAKGNKQKPSKGAANLLSDTYSKPFYNKELYEIIKKNNVNSTYSLPKLPKDVQDSDFKETTIETLKEFVGKSDDVDGNVLLMLCKAGYCAGRDLGLIPENGSNKLQLKTSREAVNELSKNTNSGFPLFGRKNDPNVKTTTENWVDNIFRRPMISKFLSSNLAMDSESASNFHFNPAKVFYRTQIKTNVSESDKKPNDFIVKIRQIFGIPFHIVAIQYMFFGSGVELVKDKQTSCKYPSYSTGSTRSDISVRHVGNIRLQHESDKSKRRVYSTDFKKFDQTIPNVFYDIFFGIFEQLLPLTKKQEAVFNNLRLYFKFTPCIYRGFLFLLSKGIASGHYITNIFDTWVHLTLVYAVHIILESDGVYDDMKNVLERNSNPFNTKYNVSRLNNLYVEEIDFYTACGDDSLFIANSEFKYYYERLSNYLGMSLQFDLDQPDSKGDYFYLGSKWNNKNEPFQTLDYMISHVVFCERYKTREDLYSKGYKSVSEYILSRTLSICLRFKNGITFIRKYLKGYEAMDKWLVSNDKSFISYPRWPTETYDLIEHNKVLDWRSY